MSGNAGFKTFESIMNDSKAREAERNHHEKSLSTTIDSFEPSIDGKTSAIRAKTQQSDFSA